jgi:hypothetical protein
VELRAPTSWVGFSYPLDVSGMFNSEDIISMTVNFQNPLLTLTFDDVSTYIIQFSGFSTAFDTAPGIFVGAVSNLEFA